MRTRHRLVCLVTLALVLTGGCGDDEDTSTTIPTSAVTTVLEAPTTTAVPVVQGVTDGAPCSPQGARGMTQQGMAMICALVGGENRWRPA
jgi:hypothetical protein